MLVGDYLFVSKVAYGPKLPNTPLAVPFTHHTLPFTANAKAYSEAVQWPYKRIGGLGKIKRNDIVVFNFPTGDTVVVGIENPDYYSQNPFQCCLFYGGRMRPYPARRLKSWFGTGCGNVLILSAVRWISGRITLNGESECREIPWS